MRGLCQDFAVDTVDEQRARLIARDNLELTAAVVAGGRPIPQVPFEGLHVEERSEALVRGTAHPLAGCLHKSGHCYSSWVEQDCSDAHAPTRFRVQGLAGLIGVRGREVFRDRKTFAV